MVGSEIKAAEIAEEKAIREKRRMEKE